MSRVVAMCFCGLMMLCSTVGSAATLSGSFTYDGLPVGSVFPDYDHGQIGVLNTGSQEWTFGTVDFVTGTYQVADLADGTYFVRLLVGPEDFAGRQQLAVEELTDWENFTIDGETQITLDFGLMYGYRITQPYSDFWPGPIGSCPYGPEVPTEFTFAWDPVPRAVSYEVTVERRSCQGQLGFTIIETGDMSVQVSHGVEPGEEFLGLRIAALSQSGNRIATAPYVDYDDGTSQGAYVRDGGGGGGGRAVHPSASVFVPQVARLPGVAPSYWTSDLIVTNPDAAAVTATLIFTERGMNGLDAYLETSVTVPGSGCLVLADVVGDTLGVEGAGWLEVSPSSLGVTSRISTPGSEGGSYGQGFPALTLDDAASAAGPVTTLAAGGVVRGAFRTNLVLTEVWGEAATFRVRLKDRDGVVLGTRNEDLDPFETRQLNDVVSRLGGPAAIEDAQVTVEVLSGGGRVVSVLSLVDQATGDPTTLVLTPIS
jgi:hypothetical protein